MKKVFDVTKSETFKNLDFWFNKCLNSIGLCDDDDEENSIPVVVIGNKTDLNDRVSNKKVFSHTIFTVKFIKLIIKQVNTRDALRWCNRINTDCYFESTAKDDINVQEAFRAIARKGLNKKVLYNEENIDLKKWGTVKLNFSNSNEINEKKCFC